MKMGLWVFILGIVICLVSFEQVFAFGEDSSEEVSPVTKAARERTYAGGRDEEDLDVQPQLLKPTRKMGGQEESAPEPSNDDEF